MQRRAELSIEAAFIFTLVFCLCDRRTVLALICAAGVHEAGHMLCLMLLGGSIKNIKIEVHGLCIEYGGGSETKNILVAAAGPIIGAAYAMTIHCVTGLRQETLLLLSAELSLILSAFNLLPALPLDGGIILRETLFINMGSEEGERRCRELSVITGALLLTAGTGMIVCGYGMAVITAAIWLLLAQNDEGVL